MFDFYLDTRGEHEKSEGTFDGVVSGEDKTLNPDFKAVEKQSLYDKLPDLFTPEDLKRKKKNSSIDFSDTYLITNYCENKSNKILHSSNISKLLETKSVITPDLEKMHSIPIIKEKVAKAIRKKEKNSTKGEDWYNLPATEITDNIKNDLQILKMRSVLDKNHFYKKNDIKNISKYFQVGRVVENAADFYSGRIVKSQRKKTIVDELLADAEFKSYQKKKYKEIMDTNRRKRRVKSRTHSKNMKKKKTKKTV